VRGAGRANTHSTNSALCVCFFSERDAQRADARRRESESETQLRDIHSLSNQLANRNQSIQEYISQNKADALQRLTADLDACKKRQDKLEAEVQVPRNSTCNGTWWVHGMSVSSCFCP